MVWIEANKNRMSQKNATNLCLAKLGCQNELVVSTCRTSAPAQPPDVPGVSDQLGARGVVLLPPPLPAATRHAGLRDQLQVQQLLGAADGAGEAPWLQNAGGAGGF